MSNPNTQAQTLSGPQLLAELDRLRAELAKAQAQTKSAGTITLRVSEKGALSVYGVGRFPVTLYSEQWTRVLSAADDIKAFMQANAARLKTKAQAGQA